MTEGTVRTIAFPCHQDTRGWLAVFEAAELPFIFQRMFAISGVPEGSQRGAHAHKKCHQLLIAVAGTVEVSHDTGAESGVTVLDNPNVGLHLPPLTWASETYVTAGAVLIVFASHTFDADDYIDDPGEFGRLAASR